ncbi:MAG: hypothetical protein ABSB40_01375 [Nitrososphaeria archaeon]|jgi:hypothetical protein
MRRFLIFGLILLLIGGILVLMPSQYFNQFADVVGLSQTTYNSTALVPPGKLYTIPDPPSSLNLTFNIQKGFSVVGNFTVVTGSTIIVLGFNSNEFKSWSLNGSGVALFYTKEMSSNGTFSYTFDKNDTYHFVFRKSGTGQATIMLLSLDLVEEEHGPSTYALILGPLLIIVGFIIVLFRIQTDVLRPRRIHEEQKSAQMKATLAAAKGLGLPIEGKTIEQIRQDIKNYMDKQKQGTS